MGQWWTMKSQQNGVAVLDHQFLQSRRMSSSYKKITPDELLRELLEGKRDIQVIDVRDADFQGGHIRGAINVPANEFRDGLDEMVDVVKAHEWVVVHCFFSQQRGPYCCAMLYNKVREVDPSATSGIYMLQRGFQGFINLVKDDVEVCSQVIEDYNPKFWTEDDIS